MDQADRKSFTPGILGSFALLLVVLGAFVLVVPRFEIMYQELEAPLPGLTRWIFISSHLLQVFCFIPILLYGVAAALVYRNHWQFDSRLRRLLLWHALVMVLLLSSIIIGMIRPIIIIIEPR